MIKTLAVLAKASQPLMAKASTQQKNRALIALQTSLKDHQEVILQENRLDIEQGRAQGLDESLIDRLSLQGGRLDAIIRDIKTIIELPDPVGELFEEQILQGMQVAKSRTPIGVLGVIYEARPNVTIDITALALKSGNCAILRGGKETLRTNQALIKAIHEALQDAHLPKEAMQLVPSIDRQDVLELLRLHAYIDLIIPRGGASLHQFCRENSTIPVITGGIGICHLFVDASADLTRSLPVIINAKTQRPTVCNALDTLLVQETIAPLFIPQVVEALHPLGVTFRLDSLSWTLLSPSQRSSGKLAESIDWDTEWLRLILGIKIVSTLDEAIDHIQKHSTGHSDGILTQNEEHANRFLREVDSAAVYVNASTRFTDGGQLGLGAEVAISTQKLHARGPMGLRELTSYKWIIKGNYSVRL